MLKKILYFIMLGIFLLFIYNNYIKKMSDINIGEIKKDIKTNNIKYDIGNSYKISANQLIENQTNETTVFKQAQAFFKNMSLKGNEAIVDKLKNMILKGNITGVTDNGWKFKTTEMRYDENKKKFYSVSKVEAKKDDIKITARHFEANSQFTLINLYTNVKLTSNKVTLSCDRVIYDRNKNIVKLNGNIKVQVKNLNSEKGKIELVTGELNYAIYDMDNNRLIVWGKFKARMKGYTLTANNLVYYKKTNNVDVYDNVKLKKDDMEINTPKAFYNGKTKKIVLNKPVKGKIKEYNFESDYMQIDEVTENIKLSNNIEIKNKESTMKADEITYDKKNNIIEGVGHENILVFGKDYRMKSKKFHYFVDENKLVIPENFRVVKNGMKINGSNLIFYTKDEIGTSKKIYIEKKENNLISDFVKFNLKKKIYNLEKNISINYEKYNIVTQKLDLDEANKKIYMKDNFEVYNKEDDLKIYSKNGEYDDNSKLISLLGKTKVVKDDYEISGDSFTYNLDDKFGKLVGTVEIKNRKDDLIVNANELTYKYKEEMDIYGDVRLKKDDIYGNTEKIVYKYKEKMGYLITPGKVENKTEKIIMNYETGEYDNNLKILKLRKISGHQEDIKFKSELAKYDEKSNEIDFIKKVNINQKELNIDSDKLRYFIKTKKIKSETPITVTEKNLKMVIQSGEMDLKNKTLDGEKGVITTEDGDKITGDFLSGDYSKKEFNFKDNLKADLPSEKMKFSGDIAKMYFKKNKDDQFDVTRGEIKNKTDFWYKDMNLSSDYLEMDNMKNLVFGKGNPVLKIDGDTTIKSDYVYLNLNTNTGEMKSNVKLTNITKEAGTINATANDASLNNEDKKVKMKGNIIVYQGENKVEAEEGVMDLKTNILSGIGTTKFKLRIKPKEESK
ncbi:LPS export ABC transporter periplasmic protein LptC [Haliovirga abyssi]|uniref:Organic solvent tolerance-like N-terminal domain-containing protein n=1 Tax=Haliovirga abyssi TaxID=2996794 RepID=A0AAU9D483_9FUSO|nr:LPS export ABC transporter periplasmic protein LptC [Haliovirga abyssi]BDU50786.1 hypothetical protein HLVA_13550 [Haliovirga abyssi]